MLILFIIYFFILGLLIKKYKVSEIFLLLLLVLLFAGNMTGSDHLNYKMNYEYAMSYNSSGWEFLYQWSTLIAKKIGMSFELYLLTYAIVGFVLLYKGIGYFNERKRLEILILYTIYPFFMDATQIRSFMAGAIVIYSLKYLFSENNYDVIKFIVGIIIASLFHTSSIIFLALIIIIINNQKFNSIIRNISIAISATVLLLGLNFEKVFSLLGYNGLRRIFYLNEGTSIGYKIFFLLYLILTCIFFEIIFLNWENCETKNRLLRFKNINYICLCFFPLFCLAVDFNRIHRIFAIINYIIIISYTGKNKKIIKTMGYIYAIVTFIGLIGLYTWDSVVVPIVTNSYYLKKY